MSGHIQNGPTILQSASDFTDETSGLVSISSSILNNDIIVAKPSRQRGTSWFSAALIIVNSALGAGLLAFPAAYHKAGGVGVAMGVQAVMVIFVWGALIILAVCADLHRTVTYQDVVSSLCGNFGKLSCSFFIALYSFGCCITYFIIIGDQSDQFFAFISPEHCKSAWYMDRKFTISLTSLLIILPLCFPKRMDFLSKASALGVLGVLYLGALVIVKYFVMDNHPTDIRTRPQQWTDIFLVVPTICFGYQCHVSVVPIYACLRERTLVEYTKSVTFATFLCLLCYSTTAVFGYYTFGGSINADILLSYEPTWDVLLALILLAVKTYTSYPIMSFCGRAAFETILLHFLEKKYSEDELRRHERKRRIVETIVWFFSSLATAIFIPDISQAIGLLGGLAAVFIFVFPGFCLLQMVLLADFEEYHRHWNKNLLITVSVFYMALGAFVFGLTTTQVVLSDA